MAISDDDIKEQNRLIEKQVELQAKLSRLRGEDVSKTREAMDTLREQSAMQRELIEIANIKFSSDQERLDFYQRQEKFLDKQLQNGKISYEQMQQTKKLMENIHVAQVRGDQRALEAAQKRLEKQAATTEELLKSSKAAATLANNMAKIVGFNDQAVQLGKSFEAAVKSPIQFAKVFSGELSELLSPSGVLGQVLANTALLAGGIMRQEAAFAAATGVSRDYTEVIEGLKSEFGELASVLDFYPTFQDLQLGFVGFNDLAEKTQENMARVSLSLQGVGVSASLSAQLMNEFTKSLGISAEEAPDALLSIVAIADQTKFSFQDIASAMSSTVDRLSVFGPRSIHIFGRLAQSARNMGFEIGEGTQVLMQMVDGFDTFDSAASKVASINAFLGGSFLDTYSMVMAAAEGPEKQLDLLQTAMGNAGITAENFGDNYFRAKGISDAFGVSVGNMKKFLSGAISEQELFMSDQETMNELLGKAIDPMTKLSNAVQDMSAFLSVNKEAFQTLLSSVTKVIDFFANTTIGQTLAVSYMFSTTLFNAIGLASGAFGKFGLAVMAIGATFALMSEFHDYLLSIGFAAESAAITVGMLGGALSGAAIGASFGGFPGAAVGALLGGVLGAGGGAIGSSINKDDAVNDAVVQSQGGKIKITPINKKDEFHSLSKPGGAIQRAMAETTIASNPSAQQSGLFNSAEKRLIMDFIEASKSNQSRPIRVESTVTMPNGRVLAETVNEENDRRFDLMSFGA